MTDQISTHPEALSGSERGVAAASTLGGFAALFSAAACCVLPLAFAALGFGAGGLAALVPYHWPLTIASGLAVATGWVLYVRKHRVCMRDGSCTVELPTRATLIMLGLATAFVILSAAWKTLFEAPLMAWLAGA